MTTKKSYPRGTTAVGRMLLEHERESLAAEQAKLAEKMVMEAHRASANKLGVPTPDPKKRAIERGLVRRLATALASEGLTPVMEVYESAHMRAWTNFSKIHVEYRRYDDVRLMAAVMRGLVIHEGGHLKFTVPWGDLQMAASQAGASTYLEAGAARRHKRAWNLLEDQRMETAVVSDSPRKAAYLTPMVMLELTPDLNAAAANWPLLVWRRYLPRRIRDGARKLFVMQHGPRGEALAQECEEIVDRYVRATDPVTMWDAVGDMVELLTKINPPTFNLDDAGHLNQNHRSDRAPSLSIPIDPSMAMEETPEDENEDVDVDTTDPETARHLGEVFSHLWIDPWNLIPVSQEIPQQSPEQSQQGSSQGDDGEEGDSGEGDEGGEGGEDDKSDESTEGGSSGSHDNAKTPEQDLTDEDLKEALDKAEEDRYNDGDLEGDMDAYRHALDNQDSKLPVYQAGVTRDARAQNQAEALAQEIRESFQAHINDRMPSWVEGQERGVVNVIRYETRQPWEFDFYRDYVGEDNPGFDMSVSVLLDYSSSMASYADQLAQCGYACKQACEALEIPCTVVLWDTKAMLLYDATETTCGVLPEIQCTGGTDPGMAFADLDNHRRDKQIHLVLLMTDGQWHHGWNHGDRTMAPFKAPDRYFLGFGFGAAGRGQVETLKERGCDDAWPIKNLLEIPLWMRQAMLSMI